MSEKIFVSFSQYVLSLEAGAACKSTIAIHNRSSIVDQFTIQIEGLDEAWFELSASSVKLFPGDQESVTLTLHPPRDAASKAGKYPFSVKVSSVDDPSEVATELGALEIRPYHEVMAELSPARREARREAQFDLTVRNRSNTNEVVRLAAADAEAACEFRLERDELRIPAGESERVSLRVWAKRRRLLGAKRQCSFTVSAESASDPAIAKRLVGQVAFLPAIPPWVITVGIPLLLVVGAALWFAIPAAKPTIEVFSVKPVAVMAGDSALIEWRVRGARSISLAPEPGNVGAQGSIRVAPAATTEFTLTAKNRKGAVQQGRVELRVQFALAEIVRFDATPPVVKNPRKGTRLSWEVRGADKVKIQPGIGDVDSVGSLAVNPDATTTYQLVATTKGGDVEKGVTVILETSRAALDQQVAEAEKKIKDYLAAGKHLLEERGLPEQALERFQRARAEYRAFSQQFGSHERLDPLDAEAQRLIHAIASSQDRSGAQAATKESMEKRLASGKLFYTLGRLDEAKGDLRAVIADYEDFRRRHGEDATLRALNEEAHQWLARIESEAGKAAALPSTTRKMREHLVLGQGFHERGQYDQAIAEFTACEQEYQRFQGRYGVDKDLEALAREARAGIVKAEKARELERR